MTEAEESSMATARIELRTAALEEDALTTKPTRRFADQRLFHHRPRKIQSQQEQEGGGEQEEDALTTKPTRRFAD